MFSKIKILTAVIATVTATSGWSSEGGMDAGGGDSYASEFSAIAHQIVRIIRNEKVKIGFGNQLQAAVNDTTVTSEDRVMLNGYERDAINYPEQKLIKLSRSRWDQIQDDAVRKYRLVLHEYLGILRLNDKNYALSNEIISQFKKEIAAIKCFAPVGKLTIDFEGTAYSDDSPAFVRGMMGNMAFATNAAFFTYVYNSEDFHFVNNVNFGIGKKTYSVSLSSGDQNGLTVMREISGATETTQKIRCRQKFQNFPKDEQNE